MKNISIKLDDGLDQKLETYAIERMTTKSYLVREALAHYFASANAPAGGACLDLAADLVGTAEGPADLSHNPEHMDGFGG